MAAVFIVFLCAVIFVLYVGSWIFDKRPISRREYRHLRSVMNGKADMRGQR